MNASFRKQSITRAREYMRASPVYLDTETTGLGSDAEIVEISIIDHDGSVLLDTMVKPLGQIPLDAIQIHGITDQMVENAPRWISVWSQVSEILRGRLVGIYNAEYDLRMFKQTLRLSGMPWRSPESRFFCIMKLYADYYGSRRWQNLENAGRQCGIPLPNSHRALDDTLLARAVHLHMAEVGGEMGGG